jgi:O-antigen/teichoic acid export membrane protein
MQAPTTPSESSQTSGATPPSGATPDPVAPGGQRSLFRNTVYLTAAQAATVPIAVVSNALLGRYLGPEEFGYIYVAGTMCAFAVLALEWGQQGALPALVARDRSRAGAYLGTALTWRFLMSLVISGALLLVCALLGYDSPQTWAIMLTFPASVLSSGAGAFKDTNRGFERTDIPALAHVAQQLLVVLALTPVLLLGGKLHAVLITQMVVVALIILALARALRTLNVGPLRFQRSALKSLFSLGTPFVFFDLAMVLLPNANATFLKKLAPDEVIGWYGVSQRLIGLLIFPASALIGALYPTLCRLHLEDRAEFTRVARNALYGTSLLAVPAAVGCGMFPEIGVAIFGLEKFGGAVAHLQVMSAFIFLVYFSMPLGTSILASNQQRAWAAVQCLCIMVSLVGNPFLIPYFQKRSGNGAIGTCFALVISEVVVVCFGLWLAPRGIFNRELAKSLLLGALSGAAMAGAAWVTKPISIFLAVPSAIGAYVLVAWLSGFLQPATIDLVKGIVARKLRRAG